MLRRCLFVAALVGVVLAAPATDAARSTSTNYQLDPDVVSNFGVRGGSANYGLINSGGEAATGTNASSSYKLGTGYIAQLIQSVELTLNPASTLTIPTVIPGTSQNASIQAIVRTDAPAYDLAVNQNHNLTHTDTVTTIPGVSGTIASPALWTEGTTKGLGFTITGGTQIEAKWGTTPNFKYAAMPNTATTFHSHSGYLGGSSDTTTVQYRLDAVSSQKSGTYTNIATFTATMLP